jgi:acetyltransferase-like isoleucine patch superfamily enzyme
MARIWLGENCRVNKLLATSNDEIANIIIGPNTEKDNGVLQIGRDAAAIIISSGSTLPSQNFVIDENEGYLLVGDDCMFSTGVVARTSDGHAIYDRASRMRVNHGLPIVIHNHVWVGRGVLLGKGAVVGQDAVLGQGAFVGGELAGGSVYVGQPARRVRENTTWDRTQAETINEAEIISPSRVRQTNHAKTCAKIDALGKESLGDLPVLHAISRILAATYDDEPVRAYVASRQALGDGDGALLCAEAHATRLMAVGRDAPSWLLGRSLAPVERRLTCAMTSIKPCTVRLGGCLTHGSGTGSKRMRQLLARSTLYGLLGIFSVFGLHGLALGATPAAPPPNKAASAVTQAPDPAARISIAGNPEVVYRWAEHACSASAIPDAPARAEGRRRASAADSRIQCELEHDRPQSERSAARLSSASAGSTIGEPC